MGNEGMYIDHVIYGVVDIDAAAERLRREYGLGSVPGGRHLGGTTNRIVPLKPPLYLELLGVGDTSLADAAWLAQTLNGTDRPIWWVLGVDDLDESAHRRGLPVQQGLMAMADGGEVKFRNAGMNRYPLPFFVAYVGDQDTRMRTWERRFAEAGHECVPGGFSFVEVGGGPDLMDAWLGDHGLPVRHTGAPTGITAVGIETDRGEVVIR
ncbi:MAG: VOC family protein [Thermoleophilia bacterium]